MEDINWGLLEVAMQKWPMGKRKWLAKHLSGFSATGRVMKRRKEWEHDKCPLCNQPNEDSHHVISCPSVTARRTWAEALTIFETHLLKLHTHPNLRTIIISRLRSWSTPNYKDFRYHAFSTQVF